LQTIHFLTKNDSSNAVAYSTLLTCMYIIRSTSKRLGKVDLLNRRNPNSGKCMSLSGVNAESRLHPWTPVLQLSAFTPLRDIHFPEFGLRRLRRSLLPSLLDVDLIMYIHVKSVL
jgi:hypothetical protein